MTEQARIIHFGSVCEHSDGRLILSGFHIDGGDRFENAPSDIAILSLVIERLQSELAQMAKQRNYQIDENRNEWYQRGKRDGREEVKAALRELLDVERIEK